MAAFLSPWTSPSTPSLEQTIATITRHRLPATIYSERVFVTSDRHPQMPDVPTMAEIGLDGFLVSFWAGVVAACGHVRNDHQQTQRGDQRRPEIRRDAGEPGEARR
jgi:hypothetical protein